ncbi:hypothetical protein J42TS3_23700 [Paenibacillus vini]|uniref:Uncharacterized protein n=1 Tax=Paenibacillus vini TaxID=1476024 RepID=A0ABQ4MD33_9BACL|nr:hypothetical protein J42TS3_23700 [Paenibacillus vini]
MFAFLFALRVKAKKIRAKKDTPPQDVPSLLLYTLRSDKLIVVPFPGVDSSSTLWPNIPAISRTR